MCGTSCGSCASRRTYQLSVETNKWNADDKVNYAHATARRLPAEVLLDAVYRVTGSTSKFPGVAAGTRAAALPDSGVELPSGFLTTFGRPARESACECERSSGLQLGPIMALVSGPTLGDAIADPGNELTKLVNTQGDDLKLIDELFMRILNRPATAAEIETCRKDMQAVDDDHRRMAEDAGQARDGVCREPARARAPASGGHRDGPGGLGRIRERNRHPSSPSKSARRPRRPQKLEADLKTYESTVLAKKMADWEKEKAPSIINRWQVLEPKAMSATNGSTFTKEPDGSIVVSGPNKNGVVTISAETELTGITGLRLEVLTDSRLPNKGPGRASDGNFVLNELELTAAPKADLKQAKPVKLANALADFSQASLEVAKAIDGSADDPSNGWASRRRPVWSTGRRSRPPSRSAPRAERY